MRRIVAFLDANVLYPAELRSLLMHLAVAGLYQAKWSSEVHEEWISNLLRNRPDLTRMQLERTRELMDRHAGDALVSGYEHHIAGLQLPDPNDRHVLAAAIQGKASIIVTVNRRDFPPDKIRPYGISAKHPDDFITQLLARDPAAVFQAAQDHRLSLKNPPKSETEYLAALERQGLLKTAAILHRMIP